MSFKEIFAQTKKILSFEFFPPKEEADLAKLYNKISELSKLEPDFMNVTYGAGGGTRVFTNKIVTYINSELHRTAVAHLTCVGQTLEELDTILSNLEANGIKHILALRGDPQNTASTSTSAFNNARDLVKYIKKRGDFSIAVSGYPETHPDAISPQAEIAYLKEKIDSGAELIITQMFFDADMYFRFQERASRAGINVPIQPGIMPFSGLAQLERFTQRCSASIPDKLRSNLEAIETKDEKEFCVQYVVELCRTLLKGGAPGIHIYTLNQSNQTKPLVAALSDFEF